MGRFITFGEQGTGTVHGASHKKHGQDCEDWSGATFLPEIEAYAFTVADGHGDPSCTRSARGAKFAVDLSLRWLGHLAKGLANPSSEAQVTWRKELLEKRGEAPLLRNPARAIVRDWRQAVRADLEADQPGEDELDAMGERGRQWLEQDRPEMLYGATLLAGVVVQDLVVVLQQGDGCFGVMYGDARVEFPMPEDELCQGNVTTSLCDANAAQGMRFVVLNRAQEDPVACFVCTDGVDKSLMQAGGIEDFFWEATLGVLDQEDEPQARNWMCQLLDEVSEHGAGDDASLAGYVDIDRAMPLRELLIAKRDDYVQSQNRRLKEQRVISMERRAAHNQYENEQIDRKIAELRRERDEGLLENERRIKELEEQRAKNEEYIKTYESLKQELTISNGQNSAQGTSPEWGAQQPEEFVDALPSRPQANHVYAKPATDEQAQATYPMDAAPVTRAQAQRRLPVVPIVIGVLVVLSLVAGGVFLVPKLMGSSHTEEDQTSATTDPAVEGDGDDSQEESPEVREACDAVSRQLGDLGSESQVAALMETEKVQALTNAYVAQNALYGATEVPGLEELATACLSSARTEVGDAYVVDDSAIVTVNFTCGSATRSEQSGQSDVASLVQEATNNVMNGNAGNGQTTKSGNARVYLEKRDGEWELCYSQGLAQEVADVSGFFEVCDTAYRLVSGVEDTGDMDDSADVQDTEDTENTEDTEDTEDSEGTEGEESAEQHVGYREPMAEGVAVNTDQGVDPADSSQFSEDEQVWPI